MRKLPDKPSELLKVALTDLELVELDDRYSINMSRWHRPYRLEGICHVCLAGSVMAKSLRTNTLIDFEPNDFHYSIGRKLLAINNFRIGDIDAGLDYLGIESRETNLEGIYDSYEISVLSGLSQKPEDRAEWKMHMCTIIGVLEAEGL